MNKPYFTYKGYEGSIEYSEDDKCYFGKVQGIKSLISYEGNTPEELEEGFRLMVDDYLILCQEVKIAPETPQNPLRNQ